MEAGSKADGMRVLVIDDERNIRATLSLCLEEMGCHVVGAASAEAAVEAAERAPFDLALLDLRLDKASGLDLLPRLLTLRPRMAVVVITAYATVDTAVEAIKRGAFDYLPKPFSPPQIRHLVEQVVARRRTERKVETLEARLSAELPEADLDSSADAMRSVLEVLARAAPSEAPVLLRGESGTGKGVLAQALHAQSRRASGPFVTVHCPTLTDDLLASELFGHARGAFTGAVREQPGRVETAEGGTLFLDEIGEISPTLQAKLLRFVQDKEFERVGENRTRRANVRVLAATHRNLEEDVRQGRFREDLLFRLNVIEVCVPPLRERPEDVLRLARRFVDFFARAAGRRPLTLSPDFERVVCNYPWPGNVRELRNAMERAVILWPHPELTPDALPERMGAAVPGTPRVGGNHTLEELEHAHLVAVLARAPSAEEAARILGIDPSTLWRKKKRLEDGRTLR